MVTNRLEQIERTYLGSQPVEEFVEMGGDIWFYSIDVFLGNIFGYDNPADKSLGVETAGDLANALEELYERRTQ